MKVSALAAGSGPRGDPPAALPSSQPFSTLCGSKSPQGALREDVDLWGRDSLQACVTLGGSWASLCPLLACRVPGPRSILLTCWWLPVPLSPWLLSALPVSTGPRVGSGTPGQAAQ